MYGTVHVWYGTCMVRYMYGTVHALVKHVPRYEAREVRGWYLSPAVP